jgi:ribosome-associated toxin RatA of RatAB toxin-antitoxin module
VAELTTEHTFEGAPAEVFAGIHQYARYPDYLPGVTKIEILPAKKPNSVCQVRYDLKLIKTFFYTLNMFEENPKRIWWDLHESNIMKQSNGGWTLTPAGAAKDQTKAVYALDIVFKGLVPQAIVDQITKANLPGMMKGFQQLIKDVQG